VKFSSLEFLRIFKTKKFFHISGEIYQKFFYENFFSKSFPLGQLILIKTGHGQINSASPDWKKEAASLILVLKLKVSFHENSKRCEKENF